MVVVELHICVKRKNYTTIMLDSLKFFEFAFIEKRVTHGRTNGGTDGRTKPLIEFFLATKTLFGQRTLLSVTN